MLFIYCAGLKLKTKKIVLPKEVINHINQYRNKEFIKISKKAWSILFDLLKSEFKIDTKKEKVCFSKNHKPYLKSKRVYFSISHSLNLIAIGVSDKPIGVDIEKMIPIKVGKLIAKRILNKKELKQYSLSKNKSDFITQIWTKKEALIKLKDSSILNIDELSKLNVNKVFTQKVKDELNNIYYLSFISLK